MTVNDPPEVEYGVVGKRRRFTEHVDASEKLTDDSTGCLWTMVFVATLVCRDKYIILENRAVHGRK